MTDDEILAALAASSADPRFLAYIVEASGVEPTGDAVADVRALAAAHDVQVESLLYGLFDEDSPIYQETE